MLCPYCGHFSEHKKECDRCRGLFEPLSRQASQNGMGPWFIRDETNPFRPGCSYATMRMLVSRKRIVPESVLRGPSTRQFWTFAKNTPGIAHLLGECHACHQSVSPDADRCPHCSVLFSVEEDRQYLGLAEVRLIPGQAPPATIARAATHSAPRPSPGQTPPHRSQPDEIALAPLEEPSRAEAPSPEPAADIAGHHSPYEPIRHSNRPPREEVNLSDSEIAALLRRSGASVRAERGTHVVAALIVVAFVGIVVVLVAAVLIAGHAVAKRPATTAGTSSGPLTPAPSSSTVQPSSAPSPGSAPSNSSPKTTPGTPGR